MHLINVALFDEPPPVTVIMIDFGHRHDWLVVILAAGWVATAGCRDVRPSDDSLDDQASDQAESSSKTPSDSLRASGDFHSGFFTDRTDRLADNPSRQRYGVAMTDMDDDRRAEAFVAGHVGASELFDWRSNQLVDIAPESLQDADRRAIGVAACDIDADGREEIYVLNVDRFRGRGEVADRLWDRRDGEWVDLFEQPENRDRVNRFSGRSVACLDRQGDGRYGFFVANYGGPMRLFELDDQGRLQDVAPEAGLDITTGGRALVSLPVGDSGMDMFAGNEGGANALFRNRGDGTFENIADEAGVADPAENVRGAVAMDANRDGQFDLVYGNWEGPHRMWLRDEGDTFELATPDAMEEPSRIRTVITADFDHDTREELFWNNIGQPNRLFERRDGAWTQADIGAAREPRGAGTGGAVGDLDGDGWLDLLVSRGESKAQPLTLYVTEPHEDRHGLRVAPETRHGAPARGAIVALETEQGEQHRIIDAGSGYLCQMEPVAHFGLGDQTAVESIEITWPGGDTWTGRPPEVDGTLTVTPSGDTEFVAFEG